MSFLSPEFLWLFVVVLGTIWYRKSKKEYTIAKSTRQKLVLLYISLMMLILSLARPVLEQAPIKQKYEGAEVVIALDLSYSMHAQDLEPDRLEASKVFIKELIRSRVHERFALLGFTSNAIILSPLTSDDELLFHQLDLIESELVITKGTNMSSVLELSTRLSQVKKKNLIIIGDGGDAKDFDKDISYANEHGLSISMVMMASREGARLRTKHGAWLKDSSDHLVISSSNSNVSQLTDATGGVYIDGMSDDALSELSKWLDSREKKLSSADVIMYKELFYYPLFLALLFFMLGTTKLHLYVFRWVLVLLALAGINLQADMREFSTQSTDKVEVEQKYIDQLNKLKKRAFYSPEDHYNLGNAYYQAGQYEEAIDTYKVIRTTKPGLKAKLLHNLGNAYVRLEMYDEARMAYKQSLIIAYDKETDENLLHVSQAKKHEGMQTGQQKGKKKNESKMMDPGSKKDAQKKKGAGSSNMKVSAQAGAGAKNKGKKVKNEGQIQFNAKQSGLSYRQYELINERKINEETPW